MKDWFVYSNTLGNPITGTSQVQLPCHVRKTPQSFVANDRQFVLVPEELQQLRSMSLAIVPWTRSAPPEPRV